MLIRVYEERFSILSGQKGSVPEIGRVSLSVTLRIFGFTGTGTQYFTESKL